VSTTKAFLEDILRGCTLHLRNPALQVRVVSNRRGTRNELIKCDPSGGIFSPLHATDTLGTGIQVDTRHRHVVVGDVIKPSIVVNLAWNVPLDKPE